MVNIRITKEGYTVSGHADQAEHGYDIVCSAISALTQTFALALKKHSRAKVSDNKVVYEVKINKYGKIEKILIGTLVSGLEKIEEEYPKHVKLRIQRGVI